MRHLLFVMMVGAAALSASSCENKDPVDPTVVPVPTLAVTPAGPISIDVGQTVTLSASVTGFAGTPTITHTSSGAVATVSSSGVVTCVAPGTATVTVRVTGTDLNGRSSTLSQGVQIVCNAAPITDLIQVTPSAINFTHIIGTTGCPQSVGTIRVTNLSGDTISISVVSGNTAISVDASNGFVFLAPGASRDVAVTFTCATQVSFTSTITVTAQAGPLSATKRVDVNATIRQ